MHGVPRLRTKVVRGIQEFSQDRPKAGNTNTVRTPTDKSVWGMFYLIIVEQHDMCYVFPIILMLVLFGQLEIVKM